MSYVFILLLGVMLAVPPARAQSGLHGDGHAGHHEEYSHWTQPGSGVSCCNDADCRPTVARPGADGWEAWDGHEWLPIPPRTVLPFHAKDGHSHLCEIDGEVYCFTPAEPRG
jgi:hypothetical protein